MPPFLHIIMQLLHRICYSTALLFLIICIRVFKNQAVLECYATMFHARDPLHTGIVGVMGKKLWGGCKRKYIYFAQLLTLVLYFKGYVTNSKGIKGDHIDENKKLNITNFLITRYYSFLYWSILYLVSVMYSCVTFSHRHHGGIISSQYGTRVCDLSVPVWLYISTYF